MDYSEEEFLKLPAEVVSKIVKEKKMPKVGVFMPDSTRRTGILFYDLKPESPDFIRRIYDRINQSFFDVVKIMFDHGVPTLLLPLLNPGNLRRGDIFKKASLLHGLKFLFTDPLWVDFYEEYDIRVKVFGNMEELREFDYVLEWIAEIEEKTASNSQRRLFLGIAYSNWFEYPRLVKLGIEFFQRTERFPSVHELIEIYYRDRIDEVDYMIRPTMIRDSDMQPLLISGRKTQMYFTVSPFIFFNDTVFKKILYDLIYLRTVTKGGGDYKDSEVEGLKPLKEFYVENRNSVIGMGRKIGKVWVPREEIE